MDHDGDVRRVRVKTRAHNPSDLSMRLNTLADKLRARTKDKISFYAFPHQMELIGAKPHVCSGASDGVLLPAGVVSCRAGILNLAHIGLSIKKAVALLLSLR